jgi:hypothetical protein
LRTTHRTTQVRSTNEHLVFDYNSIERTQRQAAPTDAHSTKVSAIRCSSPARGLLNVVLHPRGGYRTNTDDRGDTETLQLCYHRGNPVSETACTVDSAQDPFQARAPSHEIGDKRFSISYLRTRRHTDQREIVNDPSAGSPTETLLRLLLPLDDQVRFSFRATGARAETRAEGAIRRPH